MMMTRQDKTKYNILKSTYEFKVYKAYNKFIKKIYYKYSKPLDPHYMS